MIEHKWFVAVSMVVNRLTSFQLWGEKEKLFRHSQMGIHQQMGLLYYLWIKQVKLVVIDQLDNRLVIRTQLPLRERQRE